MGIFDMRARTTITALTIILTAYTIFLLGIESIPYPSRKAFLYTVGKAESSDKKEPSTENYPLKNPSFWLEGVMRET